MRLGKLRTWLGLIGAVTVTGGTIFAGQAHAAGPRPDFQAPFPCGQQVRAHSYGHAPALDIFRVGGVTEGNPVIAPAAGRVVVSRFEAGAGNVIQIDHGGQWFTTYIHLQNRSVVRGQQIRQGAQIGRVGRTGTNAHNTPHLHFEMAIDRDGNGRADWGVPNDERIPPVFDGVTYGQAHNQTYQITSDNGCVTPPAQPVVTGGKLVDFDNDGKTDVLGFDYRGDGLYFIPNTTVGGVPSRGESVLVSSGWGVIDDFQLADYDGDGKVDILGRWGDTMQVWLNTSTPGRPSTTSWNGLGDKWNTLQNVMMGEFTGDGKIDIVGFSVDGKSFWVVPNTSTPGRPSRGASMMQGVGWGAVSSVMVADYDGDGKTDILGRAGDVMYGWRNISANGRPILSSAFHLGIHWNTVSETMMADFTGDGKIDILGYSRDGDSLWVVPNTSTPGRMSRAESVMQGEHWRTVSDVMLADYDNDGKTDIIGQHEDSLFVWRNTSANGRPSVAPWVGLGVHWNSIGSFLTAKPQF